MLPAEIFASRSSRNIIPLIFVAVIVLLATRYGAALGIFGITGGGLIFSVFLFAPCITFACKTTPRRANIGWMLLAGIALSYLLAGPPQTPRNE